MGELLNRNIQKEILRSMDYWRIPGAVVGIQNRENPPEIHCFGYRDAEAGKKMDEDTRFCMASVSKSFTSMLVGMLCDQGLLDLDRPVREFAPDLQFRDDRPVSLRDMLSHRSGLANHDALWPGEKTRAEVAKQIRFLDYNLPFRTRYQYNNLLYVMAGYVCEYVTGSSYPELLRRYIFDPLGMEDASSTADAILGSGDMAIPYQVFGQERKRLNFWNMDMAAPAAGVNASVKDMLRWVTFHLRGGVTADGRRLISEDRFRDLHRIQILFSDAPLAEDSHFVYHGYNMGWRTATFRDVEMQLHTGKIEGYSSIQAYVPEAEIGIVIMMNLHSPADGFFGGIIFDLLNEVIYREKTDWLARLRKGETAAGPEEYADVLPDYCRPYFPADISAQEWAEGGRTSAKTSAAEQNSEQTEGSAAAAAGSGSREKPSAILAGECGQYRNPGYGDLNVYQKDGQLFLHYRDQDLVLHPAGDHRYYMEGVKEDIWTIRMPVWYDPEEKIFKVRYEEKLPPIEFAKV